jgi:hypothetical protein
MALSEAEKAARKAARKAANARDRERAAEKAAEAARLAEEAEHAQRFNPRSTRNAVAKSLGGRALTIEEYRIAEARRLVGPVSHPEPRAPFDVVAATEWLGVSVATGTEASAPTHGHKADDYIEPSPHAPVADEWDEDARDGWESFTPFQPDDETLNEFTADLKDVDWNDFFRPADRYELLADVFVDDDMNDSPDWERE